MDLISTLSVSIKCWVSAFFCYAECRGTDEVNAKLQDHVDKGYIEKIDIKKENI